MPRLLQEVFSALDADLRRARVPNLHLGPWRDVPAPELAAFDLAVQAPEHVASAAAIGFRQQDAELVAPQAKEMVDRTNAGLEPAADHRHRAVGGAILACRRDPRRVAKPHDDAAQRMSVALCARVLVVQADEELRRRSGASHRVTLIGRRRALGNAEAVAPCSAQDVANTLLNFEHAERSSQVVFGAELDPATPGIDVPLVGHQQDGNAHEAGVRLENAQDLEAVDLGHRCVEHEQVRGSARDHGQHLRAVRRRHDVVPGSLAGFVKQTEVEWIWVPDENQGAHRAGSLALGRVWPRSTAVTYHGVPAASNLRAREGDASKLCAVVAPARLIAARVLERVASDDAWATPTLDAELRRASVKRVDAALATQIVYGSLRTLPELEAAIRRHVQRPLKVDDWTRAVLIGAVYQLLYLERVPPYAVVNDAVELVRMKRGKRIAGFANAVLRKVAADRPEAPHLPSSLAVPDWLRESLRSSIGSERAESLLRVGDAAPSIDLRVRADLNRDAVADAIVAAHPEASVTRTALSPQGLRIRGAGDPRALPGYQRGAFAAQEEGAQLVGLMLGTEPGDRVLDACAGRGGKTAQLAEAVGDSGSVVATDLHEHRLEQIPAELARLRLDRTNLQTAAVDWTIGKGGVQGEFDRVLVDAPCTGLGTLRRRPEILLRTGSKDPARMGEKQRRLLETVAPLVRRGGTLLYAVCSPLNEEGTEVVAGADLPGFDLQVDRPSHWKSLCFDSSGRLEVGPGIEGAGPWADAYQVYMWVNVG